MAKSEAQQKRFQLARAETQRKIQEAIDSIKEDEGIVTKKKILELTGLSSGTLSKPHVIEILKKNKVCQFSEKKSVSTQSSNPPEETRADMIYRLTQEAKKLEAAINRLNQENSILKEKNQKLKVENQSLNEQLQKARGQYQEFYERYYAETGCIKPPLND